MTPTLHGFVDELVKLAVTRKNPYALVETKMEKLLKGGLQKYLGSPEIRHPTFPPMAEVANHWYREREPRLNLKPPSG